MILYKLPAETHQCRLFLQAEMITRAHAHISAMIHTRKQSHTIWITYSTAAAALNGLPCGFCVLTCVKSVGTEIDTDACRHRHTHKHTHNRFPYSTVVRWCHLVEKKPTPPCHVVISHFCNQMPTDMKYDVGAVGVYVCVYMCVCGPRCVELPLGICRQVVLHLTLPGPQCVYKHVNTPA